MQANGGSIVNVIADMCALAARSLPLMQHAPTFCPQGGMVCQVWGIAVPLEPAC
jgi:hypothetical protein